MIIYIKKKYILNIVYQILNTQNKILNITHEKNIYWKNTLCIIVIDEKIYVGLKLLWKIDAIYYTYHTISIKY